MQDFITLCHTHTQSYKKLYTQTQTLQNLTQLYTKYKTLHNFTKLQQNYNNARTKLDQTITKLEQQLYNTLQNFIQLYTFFYNT